MAYRKSPSPEKQKETSASLGVPFWQDKDAYEKLYGNWDGLDKDQQRWEFLRRDADYRADWEEHIKKPSVKHTKVIGRSKFTHETGMSKGELTRRYELLPPIDPALEWKRVNPKPAFFRSRTGGQLVYPTEPCPFSEAARAEQEAPEHEKEMAQLASRYDDKLGWYGLKVHIEFDLGYSLSDQITEARKNLAQAVRDAQHFMDVLASDPECEYEPKSVGEENARTVTKKASYPRPLLLLRISDAFACGCTDGDIVAQLIEHDKGLNRDKVRDNFLFAKKYWQRL